jgi:tetratricopeptide (TPR) repeat protein
MKRLQYRFLVCLIFAGFSLNSQTRDEQITRGIDYVYQMKYDSANAVFQTFIDQDPKDPTGYFLQSTTEWWKIYQNKEDRSNDDNYLSKVDKCIKACEERLDANENDDWATFMMGGVIGYRGFMNAMRNNWLSAIDDGKQGLNLIQKSHELNPGNKDALLGMGIYNYAVDYVVERYPFLKAVLFFFPKGNKELGLAQLRDCAENGKFSRVEANVHLTFIHLSYEKNYNEALKYASKLVGMYPQNPMFERFLGKCYVGLFRHMEGVEIYKGIIAKADSSVNGYNNDFVRREAVYYMGLCYSRMNNPDEALKYYEQTIELCKKLDKPEEESAYYVFSVLGAGMIHDQKGNRGEAIRHYDMVLNMKDVDGSHANAQKYKDSGYK